MTSTNTASDITALIQNIQDVQVTYTAVKQSTRKKRNGRAST